MRARLSLGAVGVALGVFGVYQLLGLGLDNLVGAAIWLAGGVLIHDGVLAFATIAVVWTGALLLPLRLRAPLAAAFVVVGTVTLTAVPVLGRFGARADNPTLLDRHYLVGWLAFVALVGTATVVGVLRSRRPDESPTPEE